MCSLIETIQKKRFLPTMPYKDDLPISQSAGKESNLMIGIRKRMFSSFSVNNIQQPRLGAPNTASSWAFRKSRSMPSLREFTGGPLRRWWESSWRWLLSKKKPPAFAKDIEMEEEEEMASRGSQLRNVFYKVRSEILKLVRTQTLPTTHKFRYDSFSYAQNFDVGNMGGGGGVTDR